MSFMLAGMTTSMPYLSPKPADQLLVAPGEIRLRREGIFGISDTAPFQHFGYFAISHFQAEEAIATYDVARPPSLRRAIHFH